MSYLSPEQTAFKDGPNLDAFGRLRTSVGVQVFGLSQEYSPHPLVWDNHEVSGGTVTHNSVTNSSTLSTNGSTSGARAVRQTKVYIRYTPGKSQYIKRTGVLRSGGQPSDSAYTALGYYDDYNGLLFKDTSSGVAVGERSDISGSVVETLVYQADWNIDKFDGTGPSGKLVDWSKTQIFIIDIQWLGAGRVRYGLDIDGALYYGHQSVHANLFPSVYMGTANLPLRSEAFNEGGAGSNVSLNDICSSVESEGGVDEQSVYNFAYSAYVATPLSVDGTMRPIVSRRLRDTFNGKTTRGKANLKSVIFRVGSNDIYWEIRYNQAVMVPGTTITSPIDSIYSMSEIDTYTGTVNTVSGGVLMFNGFASTGSGNIRGLTSSPGITSMAQLGRTYDNVRDTFTLSARSLGASSTVSICVQVEETY